MTGSSSLGVIKNSVKRDSAEIDDIFKRLRLAV